VNLRVAIHKAQEVEVTCNQDVETDTEVEAMTSGRVVGSDSAGLDIAADTVDSSLLLRMKDR
jgi:hypothetical protein